MNRLRILTLMGLSAFAGGFAGWKLCRLKYEQRVQAEIDSVRKAFSGNDAETNRKAEPEMEEEPEGNLIAWATAHRDRPYVNYSGTSEAREESKDEAIYVIPEKAFGELDNYDNKTLLWYGGNVLTDPDGDRVSLDLVGGEALELLSQEGEEVVYVRNEELETDFEIVRETDDFGDND